MSPSRQTIFPSIADRPTLSSALAIRDWVREQGFDGYRVDTAKHFEPAVSAELKREAEQAQKRKQEQKPKR